MRKKIVVFLFFAILICICALVLFSWMRMKRTEHTTRITHVVIHVGPAYAYPDPKFTPGDVDPRATIEKICTHGYAASVRHVTEAEIKKVFAEYHIPYPPPPRAYQLDHDVPLELAGSNSIKNLWVEAADPRPGFHEKDQVENYLHREVCKGSISLPEAQEEIKRDWLAIYLTLPKRKKHRGHPHFVDGPFCMGLCIEKSPII